MRFTLAARLNASLPVYLYWSNEGEDGERIDPILRGSEDMIRRITKAVVTGREWRKGEAATLASPHAAYHTCIMVMREQGALGPIDFAGYDDDGQSMMFMPEPEVDHLHST